MAGIRKRATTLKEASTTPSSVASTEKLLAAVTKLKQTATDDHGITSKQLLQCVQSAAEKNQIKLIEKKKIAKKSSPPRSQWLTVLLVCYRVAVLCCLAFTVACLLFLFFPTVSSFILKHMHTRLYSIIRPVRMVIAMIMPVLSMLRLDFINSSCVFENPFVPEANFCPCLRVTGFTELVLSAESPTIPESFFQLPAYEMLVVRNAVDTANVSLDAFRDFKRNHPTQRGPKTCLKLTTNSKAGVQKMADLYNPEVLEEQLNSKDAWAFSWEECPVEDRPQTFSSLYPPPDYLPPDTELSNITLYTLGTQYAQIEFNLDTFTNQSQLLATLVLLGEVRFSVEQMHENCFGVCRTLKDKLFLKAGDVLLMYYNHWSFTAVPWSQHALIATVAVGEESVFTSKRFEFLANSIGMIAETLSSEAETLSSEAETLSSEAETLSSEAETLSSETETLSSEAETLSSEA